MTELFPTSRIRTIKSILSLAKNNYSLENMWDIEWYVNRCEISGFCNTDDIRRNCALRYMAGKRKITPPGTRKEKETAKVMRNILLNPPLELLRIIDEVSLTEPAKQFSSGNDKAINKVIGMVLKLYKIEPLVAKELLVRKLKKKGL
jgi:hypothetical protein